MADFIRRLVSGNRTRFKDAELDVELDLTYITDNVVVMGYPAAGVEGMYRNRREDAKKFLDYRHGSNYWVFNFCPIRENSYDPNFFHGRVSRYPFPDHHAPPLAILALASREIALWLNGSPDRVAVLHCKAGKGRSGTLACAYLLSLDAQPSAPQLERNYSKKELAKFKIPLVTSASTHVEEKPAIETVDESQAKKDMAKERAEEFMNEMPADEAPAPAADTDTDEDATGASASTTSLPKSQSEVPNLQPKVSTDSQRTAEKAQADGVEAHDFAGETPKPGGESKVLSGPQVASPVPRSSNASPASSKTTSRLAAVLDFHTSRRIRPKSPSSSSSSSSSSDNEAESTSKPPEVSPPGPPPKQGRPQGVSISSQRRFLWYWSLVLADEAPKGFWPPLPYPPTSSEYDPKPQRASVRVLDAKVRMRDHNSMTASAVKTGSKLLGRFMDGKAKRDPADIWVSMARYDDDLVGVLERWERWGRETGIGGLGKRRVGGDQMPAVGSQDTSLRHEVREVFKGGEWDTKKMVRSFARLVAQEGKEVRSGKIITETLASRDDVAGVTIDANREVRFKIYMGKVFMAWMWLIPTFHLPDPSSPDAYEPVTLTFTKEDLDFPIGLGASLVDVQFTLQRVPANAPAATPPPRAQSSQDEGGGTGAVLGAVEGPAGLRERVNARQGLED